MRLARVSSHTPSSPSMFSSLSIHSEPVNKCGMSFTVVVKRLIFIKKRRNGHLSGTQGIWVCYDSDDKCTWQLNYVLNSRFLFYSGDRNPFWDWPLWLNTWKVAFMLAPAQLLFLFGTLLCVAMLWCPPTYKRNIHNEEYRVHPLTAGGSHVQHIYCHVSAYKATMF